MLKEYEFTVITSVQIPETEAKAALKKYEDMFTVDGGLVVEKDEWGVMRLAYPIKKQFKGRYVCYKLATTHTAIAAAEKLMRIDQCILRYLNIKLADSFDPSSIPADSVSSPQTAASSADSSAASSAASSADNAKALEEPTSEDSEQPVSAPDDNSAFGEEVTELYSSDNTDTHTDTPKDTPKE
ncbi:MAG: 30S ribosomal protein S6 [Proteobacteria bacterium]|nr:30S ribosomal protein S6 [Pseudomonadota bacterium]